jgi:hypothetical protein
MCRKGYTLETRETDHYLDKMIKMRAAGKSLREIGEALGVSSNKIFQDLRKHNIREVPRLWRIESATELVTWLRVRKEIHIHCENEKNGQCRWMLVERRTPKCGTNKCLKVGTVN